MTFTFRSLNTTNSEFIKFKKFFSKKLRLLIVHLVLTALKDRIEEIRRECETAVREGSTTLILSDKNI